MASFFKQTTLENGLINEKKYHSQGDSPLLVAVPAYLKCKVVVIMEKGDNHMFIEEVKNTLAQKTLEPLELITTCWNYGG